MHIIPRPLKHSVLYLNGNSFPGEVILIPCFETRSATSTIQLTSGALSSLARSLLINFTDLNKYVRLKVNRGVNIVTGDGFIAYTAVDNMKRDLSIGVVTLEVSKRKNKVTGKSVVKPHFILHGTHA